MCFRNGRSRIDIPHASLNATISRFRKATCPRNIHVVRCFFSCVSFDCPSFGCVPSSHEMHNGIETTECTKLPETLGRNTRLWRERPVPKLEDVDADSVQLCHCSPHAVKLNSTYHPPASSPAPFVSRLRKIFGSMSSLRKRADPSASKTCAPPLCHDEIILLDCPLRDPGPLTERSYELNSTS